MGWTKFVNGRLYTILMFISFSSIILSFVFEGQVFHSLLDLYEVNRGNFVLVGIFAQFIGLFFGGFFIKTEQKAKDLISLAILISFPALLPFFWCPSLLWWVGLVLAGCGAGAALAAWGFLLRAFTLPKDRLKVCADVLILSNLIMILINVLAVQVSPFLALGSILIFLPFGLFINVVIGRNLKVQSDSDGYKDSGDLKASLFSLFIFIVIITINSGLMYEVINPAFAHLTLLTSWYWAVPYILALFIMRNLPGVIKHSHMLYAGIAMMIGAFISFMLLGRTSLDYLIVDTLMLAACGIFDLFWWSILAEMLDYSPNAALVFGVGLSANVLGILAGGALGMSAHSINMPGAEITVLALTVVCITLVILPLLNRRLGSLLKNHAYLVLYEKLDQAQQEVVLYGGKPLEPLTNREQEVLQQLLTGKTNREIAASLFVTENTVKTHARNIFSKYAVRGRIELISRLLREDADI